MYREKMEPKYYKIRADVAWGFVLCIGLLLMIGTLRKHWLMGRESDGTEQEGHREWIEVNYDDLRICRKITDTSWLVYFSDCTGQKAST